MTLKFKPAVLMILDGFGVSTPDKTNAIWSAQTPFLDKLIQNYPTMLLEASGLNVGLPWGEVGNSEVGHVNIGSGTLLYQSLPRIDKSIESGEFFKDPNLLKATEKVKKNNSKLHIMGLLGKGGVHAHQRHLYALLDFCKKEKLKGKVFLHLFLDGRDTTKNSAKIFLDSLMKDKNFKKVKAEIASLSGRFYAMDRNNNWDRIAKAYKTIALGESEKKFRDPLKAIEESYKNEVFDEEFVPVVITDRKDNPLATINKDDAVIFFNYRADRARQLTEAFVDPNFKEFGREFLEGLTFVTFIEYKKGLPVEVVFQPQIIKNPLAKIFSDHKLKQLHIAETEKYAHVTFFLNGLQEKKFPGEERILIPSPAIPSYDKQPEMSAIEVTNKLVDAIKADKFDFIAINYANPDMVGHTGNLEATIKAVETVDKCVERVVSEAVGKGGIIFILGDHGNAEELVNLQTGKMDKEHSVYPVPFITISQKHEGKIILKAENNDLSTNSPTGVLSDVAPTLLNQIGLPLAKEMTGTDLLE